MSAVIGSYLVVGSKPSFVSTVFSRFLAREMPDVVIRYAITILGNLGQKLNLISALLLTSIVLGSILFVSYRIEKYVGTSYLHIPLGLVGISVVSYILSGSIQSTLGSVVTVAAVILAVRSVEYLMEKKILESNSSDSEDAPEGNERTVSRRKVIISAVSTFLFGTLGLWKSTSRTSNPSLESENPSSELLKQADEKSFGVEGMDSLVSENFYEVDINNIDPSVSKDEWSLDINGSVENSVTIDFNELKEMEDVKRFETLRCVGESLNGEKMDTAVWKGSPVTPLLEEADVMSECDCVMVRAEDDYFEEFPISALEDAILAYQMNGRDLPRGHGAPVRLLVPGHWGEINVKWVSEMEFLDKELDGYWEKRGWHGTGPVKTVAKLHAVNSLENDRKEIGGHAYAGVRGIQKVEVSTDGGETWSEAELTEPLEPSIDAWRQWRYTYDPPDGEHTVVVRAIDGEGNIQPEEESGPYPSGPSGWVSQTIQ